MLKRVVSAECRCDGGDTLIEVTIALSILSFVLLSSTAVVTLAFRTGQTARERTVIAEAAQQQMEALRSFRDNTTDWSTFKANIDPVANSFHMQLVTVGGSTEWVPTAGALDASNLAAAGRNSADWVPTATMSLATATPLGPTQDCGFDFSLDYQFTMIGTTNLATNEIKTRLTNLHYVPPVGGPQCP